MKSPKPSDKEPLDWVRNWKNKETQACLNASQLIQLGKALQDHLVLARKNDTKS